MEDNGWFVLAFFMIVVGIPVIGGIWGDMYKRRMKLREKEIEIMGAQTAEKAAQYAANQTQLLERVAVLERIVTDQGYSLAKEIESLRSLPEPVTPTHEKEVLK
jgi:hypothetical protein